MIDAGWANEIVKSAVRKGADQAEAYVLKDEFFRMVIERGELNIRGKHFDGGFAVRVFKDKSKGFSFSTELNNNSLEETVRNALKIAEVKEPDPDFRSLPEPKPYTKVRGVFDKFLAELTIEEAADFAERMLISARSYDNRIIPTFGVLDLHKICVEIANSLGVEAIEHRTKILAGLRTIVKEGGETGNGFEYKSSREYKGFNPEFIGRESSRLAVSSLKMRRIETSEMTVILDPYAVANLLSTLGVAVLASNVEKNRSILCDSVGEKIGSDGVTLIDDGAFPRGLNSASFDDEGVPTQHTPLIEKGFLKGFLYDSYSAQKKGLESTGNGLRCTFYSGDKNYKYMPTEGITNFVLHGRTSSRDKLIEETADGILITFLVGMGDSTSGNFSFDIRNGFKIENGEVAYPIRSGMLTGNIIDALKNIDGSADNTRQVKIFVGVGQGNFIVPSIRMKKTLVIGE